MPLLNKLETTGTTMSPLKGKQPTTPLQSGAIPINNSFEMGTYIDTISDTPRAVDTTGNAS
tara:strand:- start:6706 stop:6888 length:183 start_codon:yes stop_codon:yes gene_type:complete